MWEQLSEILNIEKEKRIRAKREAQEAYRTVVGDNSEIHPATYSGSLGDKE